MATVNQIQYRIDQAKKKLSKLNKDVIAVKTKMKTLEGQLKIAKAASKGKPKAKPRKKAPVKK